MRTQEVSVLKAHNLKCVKGSTELFSNIQFEVESGEALVVEGSNGSGPVCLEFCVVLIILLKEKSAGMVSLLTTMKVISNKFHTSVMPQG